MFNELFNNFLGNDADEQASNLPKFVLVIIIFSFGIAGGLYIIVPRLAHLIKIF